MILHNTITEASIIICALCKYILVLTAHAILRPHIHYINYYTEINLVNFKWSKFYLAFR